MNLKRDYKNIIICIATLMLSNGLMAQYTVSASARASTLFDDGRVDEAIALLKNAGEKGDKNAFFSLGNIYSKENELVKTDMDKGIMFYKKAADLGHTHSMIRLFYIYADIPGKADLASKYMRWLFEDYIIAMALNIESRIYKAKGDLAYKIQDFETAKMSYHIAVNNLGEEYLEDYLKETETLALNHNGFELMYWLAQYYKESNQMSKYQQWIAKVDVEYRKRIIGNWRLFTVKENSCLGDSAEAGRVGGEQASTCMKKRTMKFKANGEIERNNYYMLPEELEYFDKTGEDKFCSGEQNFQYNWKIEDGKLISYSESEDGEAEGGLIIKNNKLYYIESASECDYDYLVQGYERIN